MRLGDLTSADIGYNVILPGYNIVRVLRVDHLPDGLTKLYVGGVANDLYIEADMLMFSSTPITVNR